MSTMSTALTTWKDFVGIPDSNGKGDLRYELHDGKVVLVPPPKPIHILIQRRIIVLLTAAAARLGTAISEFPYRPAIDLQFWRADVAFIPNRDWKAMDTDQYFVYTPPLIIEVLLSSDRPGKINRHRIAAFSGGALEFWVVDPIHRTIEVSQPGKPTRTYSDKQNVPVATLRGISLPARKSFGQ